jgi:hypothetical protein
MDAQSLIPPMKPQESQPIHSPMIYVKQEPAWEYKQLVYDLSMGTLPTIKQLNALGQDGWELVAAPGYENRATFCFKRLQ